MGIRVKTFDSTGVAPNGKLFAGDLNAIQDQYADVFNLLQALGVASMAIGESGLQIVRFGSGEARLTGAFRADGIIRALGGLYTGAFTTAQRDAIPSANAPYGLVILNTTTNRLEINLNSSGGAPSWQPLAGSSVARGAFAALPAPALSNSNTFYFATDQNGGTLYYSDGSSWTKISPGLTEPKIPIDGSVTTVKLADGSVTPAKAAAGAFAGPGFDTTFPTTNLFTGYRFTLFPNTVTTVGWDFIYRPDLDGTYPWVFVGGADLIAYGNVGINSTGWTTIAQITVPRTGIYNVTVTADGAGGGGGGAAGRLLIAGTPVDTGNGGSGNNAQYAQSYPASITANNAVAVQGQGVSGFSYTYEGSVRVQPVKVQ